MSKEASTSQLVQPVFLRDEVRYVPIDRAESHRATLTDVTLFSSLAAVFLGGCISLLIALAQADGSRKLLLGIGGILILVFAIFAALAGHRGWRARSQWRSMTDQSRYLTLDQVARAYVGAPDLDTTEPTNTPGTAETIEADFR